MQNRFDKVILLADIHYGVHANACEWVENIDSYFGGFFMKKLKEEAEGCNPCVVIAGDFFDNRSSIDINVLNSGRKALANMAAVCPVFMIVGNHDMYRKADNAVNSLVCFGDIEGVSVIQEISEISLSGLRIMLMPWNDDHSAETKAINKYKADVAAFIMHSEISGMRYDNGRSISEGTVVKGVKGIIYSGHIHTRQVSKNKKTVYIGSPYHMTLSDVGNVKGIYVLTEKDGGICEKFIRNDYSPVYVKVNASYENGKVVYDHDVSDLRGNYVYVVIKKKDEDRINTAKVSEEILKASPRAFEFIKDASEEMLIESTEIAVSADCTVKEVFEAAVSESPNFTNEDRDELNKLNNLYIVRAAEELGCDLLKFGL